MKYYLLVLSTSFSIWGLSGCGGPEDVKKVDLSKVEEIKDVPVQFPGVRIGLIPEQNTLRMAERYEPLGKYLTKRMDVKVTLVYLDNYGEVCDKFIYKKLDAAFFGSFSYALTHAKAGVEPLVRPDYGGTSTYKGLVLVRQDSGIKNVSDMKGKRLALVHQATYAGYLYPLYYFRQHGIKKLEEYFSVVTFAGSHDKAIFSLLRNEVDVACSKDLVYERIIKENIELKKKLAILTISTPVPSNALCVSKKFDADLKKKLRDGLLNLTGNSDGKSVLESMGATRFIETKDKDYSVLYDVIKALGIDLNTYPYYARPDMGF